MTSSPSLYGLSLFAFSSSLVSEARVSAITSDRLFEASAALAEADSVILVALLALPEVLDEALAAALR